jgi:hypothetical protein
MQQPPLTGLMPLLVFLLRQHIEVAGWTPAIGCGLLLGRLPLAAELGQFQLFQHRWQSRFQRRHARGFQPGARDSC